MATKDRLLDHPQDHSIVQTTDHLKSINLGVSVWMAKFDADLVANQRQTLSNTCLA